MNQSVEKVTYFAYGSNLLFARLHQRTPSIENLGIGHLANHQMSFNKPGGDGSGKCGIERVGTDQFVLGVLYQMSIAEKPVLDEIEGVGHGYVDQAVMVSTKNGSIEAFTYYPTKLDCDAHPYDWYKGFVLSGAIENNFPASYVSRIESIECMIDPDQQRRTMNFAVQD